VQGKLVEHKQDDGNASKIFTDGHPPEAALRYEVADNWIWIRFAAVGKQRLGKMLDQKGNRGDLKPYLRNTNVQWMRFQLDDIKELRLESDELEEYRLLPGDLLICEGGEPGRCAIWREPNREMYFQKAIHRVRPRQGILSEYLAVCLQVDAQNGVLAKYFTGATIKHFTGRSLSEYAIPLPPLAEQKRIVAKVYELMALCDRLEAQQHERETQHAALARASLSRFADAPTPASLNLLFHKSYTIPPADLRKSILTLAVQGKLVPQDPGDEPAEEILVGIAGDVAKAIRAKQMRNTRPISAYEDEFPFAPPAGWTWAPLGNLTAAEDGAMCDGPFGSKLKTEHYIPQKGYAVLRLGNIGVGHFIHGKEGHISREHFESLPSNHTAPGDLLVAGLADPLVRCCEIPPDIGHAVNKSDCFRVRLSKRMDRSYVRHYLNSPTAKAFAAEENHGMTRERINLANAKALPVSIPPLAEQRRIVAKVDQLMALVDELETQLAASRATAANLLEAIVSELTSSSK
jgi:type I restriction enzyme S subunit